MSVVSLAGAVYYGIAVHTTGFGSYKQLLPLVVVQTALLNSIAVLGIMLSKRVARRPALAQRFRGRGAARSCSDGVKMV